MGVPGGDGNGGGGGGFDGGGGLGRLNTVRRSGLEGGNGCVVLGMRVRIDLGRRNKSDMVMTFLV